MTRGVLGLILVAVAAAFVSLVEGTVWRIISPSSILLSKLYLLGLGTYSLSISGAVGLYGTRRRVRLLVRSGVVLGVLGGVLPVIVWFQPTMGPEIDLGLSFIIMGPVLALGSLKASEWGVRTPIKYAWIGATLIMSALTWMAAWRIYRPGSLPPEYTILMLFVGIGTFVVGAGITSLAGRDLGDVPVNRTKISFLGRSTLLLGFLAAVILGVYTIVLPVALLFLGVGPTSGMSSQFSGILGTITPAIFVLGLSLSVIGSSLLRGDARQRSGLESSPT